MKKVLFATTALVGTAGMAAADVTLSGSGRFGIVYNEAFSGVAGRSTTKLEKRMTINIDGSGSTDGGCCCGFSSSNCCVDAAFCASRGV